MFLVSLETLGPEDHSGVATFCQSAAFGSTTVISSRPLTKIVTKALIVAPNPYSARPRRYPNFG